MIRNREMKTYGNLYEKCLDREYIKRMIREAAKGKKDRQDVKRILGNIDRYADVILGVLERETYAPYIPAATVIKEGTRPKNREIRKVRFFDQIIHHIVVNACMEVFMRGMYEYSCGSVPKRGIHYGKRYICRWIRTDRKNTKYCLQMDIKHFFQSVDHEILKRLLFRKITDKRMQRLIEKIIGSCAEGIPLGYYTSQWFANYFLTGLDHYIKETLHVKYYVRYMDDMILFGANKKRLHRVRREVERYIRENLNLALKENWQVFRTEHTNKAGKSVGRPLDFMGFRFYHNRVLLRRSLMLRICRKARRIGKKHHPTAYDAAAMLSYMGWISATDTYNMYLARIKPYIDVKQLKKIVSKSAKRKEAQNGMDHNRGNAGRAAA